MRMRYLQIMPLQPEKLTPETKPSLSIFHSFSRSQISSLAATIVDMGSLVLFVELLGVWYVAATALGAFLGAITNFLLGRYWSFGAAEHHWGPQAIRYAVVSFLSLLLNTFGVFALTEGLHLKYIVSKATVAFLIGILFNFPMHRHFVFRAARVHGE